MIRPDIAAAVREGWEWAEGTAMEGDYFTRVCDEAQRRYTRIDRQRAFAKAAMAARIHRN
jgi:hypothetical protein